jgi:dipeptide/tripeptide permease
MSTESRFVLVQAFVAGSQEFAPQPVSLLTVHGTQPTALQAFLSAIWLQSVSRAQRLHVPLLHKEAVALVQSELDLHSTQTL